MFNTDFFLIFMLRLGMNFSRLNTVQSFPRIMLVPLLLSLLLGLYSFLFQLLYHRCLCVGL